MEMQFNGEFKVDLPREEVFELLSDPQKFAPMMPTFKSLEMKDDRTAIVKISVGIGRIRGTASTELTLDEVEAPRRASYIGKGKLMQGAYQMTSSFDLEDAPGGGTVVSWQGETLLVGKILSVAGGGMRGYAEKEINNLISSLQLALSPEAEVAAEVPAEEGFFARIWHALIGKPAAEASADTPDSKVTEVPIAPYPEDVAKAQREAHDKIEALLDIGRTEKPLARKEDDRLVRGNGFFVDDYKPHGLLHMAIVRSPYAHANILNINVSKAEALPGVVCTMTGKEAAEQTDPYIQIGPEPGGNIQDYCMAVDKAVFQGDPVAMVVAESLSIANDAAQLVDVEYEVLEPVLTCEEALKNENILHEVAGTNHI